MNILTENRVKELIATHGAHAYNIAHKGTCTRTCWICYPLPEPTEPDKGKLKCKNSRDFGFCNVCKSRIITEDDWFKHDIKGKCNPPEPEEKQGEDLNSVVLRNLITISDVKFKDYTPTILGLVLKPLTDRIKALQAQLKCPT